MVVVVEVEVEVEVIAKIRVDCWLQQGFAEG